MADKKRMGLRFFVLSFLATFSMITLVGFLVLLRVLNPAPAQSITENIPKIEHTFKDSDSMTVLAIGYSRKDPQRSYYSLIRLDAPSGRVYITTVPAETKIDELEGRQTLSEISAYSGSVSLLEKLETAFNLTIDRYLRIEESSFISLVDELGAVTYDCPKRVEYHDENGFLAYSMDKGKHVFFGEKLSGLIKYSGENETERANEQSNILCSLFSQRLSSGKYDDLQTVFELLLAGCESSINAFDFEARRAALEQITKDKDIEFIAVPFSAEQDNTPSDEFLKSLSVYR